jgi:hypothetical protein
MNWMPLLIGGGLLAGGYFLFFTREGKDMLDSILNRESPNTKKWEDPFKYLTPATADAWNPKSKMYKDIQTRIGKNYSTIDELYE